MNVCDLGPGLWVVCHLPDGRTAVADGSDPACSLVISAMRRVHKAAMEHRGVRYPGALEDYLAVSAWLDETEPLDGVLFTREAAA